MHHSHVKVEKYVPLSLPLMINSDDVRTLGGDVSHDGDVAVLATTDVIVIVRLIVEETNGNMP